jgi:hypothetical protein
VSARQPCQFRQLCAIASEALTRDPALLEQSLEWTEQVKDRVTSLGYPRPPTADVWKAMDAVEHVHRKRIGSATATSSRFSVGFARDGTRLRSRPR